MKSPRSIQTQQWNGLQRKDNNTQSERHAPWRLRRVVAHLHKPSSGAAEASFNAQESRNFCLESCACGVSGLLNHIGASCLPPSFQLTFLLLPGCSASHACTMLFSSSALSASLCTSSPSLSYREEEGASSSTFRQSCPLMESHTVVFVTILSVQ